MQKRRHEPTDGMTGTGATIQRINQILREDQELQNNRTQLTTPSVEKVTPIVAAPIISKDTDMTADEQYEMYKNLFHGGNGHSVDKEKATEYLLLAGRHGDREEGSSAAQWLLAKCYALGISPYINIDQVEAIFFLKAAARGGHESGHEKAQWLLANKYKNGDGVARSVNKHVRFLIASARGGLTNGHKEAQSMVYKYISSNHVYAKHMPKAYIKEFKANYAAGKDYPTPVEAKSKMKKSWIYLPDEILLDNEKTSVKKQFEMYKRYNYGKKGWRQNKEKAVLFLKAACREGTEAGDPYAQFYMARKYRDGDGLEKDPKKAMFYLQSSARDANPDGVPAGQWEISIMHLNASKGDKNSSHYAEHIRFLKASGGDGDSKGCVKAQRLIAIKHFNGDDGFDKNAEQGIKFLIMATRNGQHNGDAQAQEDRYKLIKQGGLYFEMILEQKSEEYLESIIATHDKNIIAQNETETASLPPEIDNGGKDEKTAGTLVVS